MTLFEKLVILLTVAELALQMIRSFTNKPGDE